MEIKEEDEQVLINYLGENGKKRKKERQKKKHDKRLLRWVPFGVDECSVVQVEVVGMCFDGQTLCDFSLCPLFFSAHNLHFIPIDGMPYSSNMCC